MSVLKQKLNHSKKNTLQDRNVYDLHIIVIRVSCPLNIEQGKWQEHDSFKVLECLFFVSRPQTGSQSLDLTTVEFWTK